MTYDPNNPSMRNPRPPRDSNVGWIAGAIIVVLVIIGLFYWGGTRTNTASNPVPNNTASSTMTPSSTTGSGTQSPAPATPAPAAPASPYPATTPPPAGNAGQ